MRIRHVKGVRPDVPEDWIICNAPRPINGTKRWTGPFIEGVFYAAIDPNDEQKDWMITSNTSNDAAQLIFYTEDELVSVGLTYYHLNYPNEIINPVKWRKYLIDRGLAVLNGAH